MRKQKIDAGDLVNKIFSKEEVEDLSCKDEDFEISADLKNESSITISNNEGATSIVLNKIKNPNEEQFETIINDLKNFQEKLDNFRKKWQLDMNDTVDKKIELEGLMEFVPENQKSVYKVFGRIFSKIMNVLIHGTKAQSTEKINTNMLILLALNKRLEKDFTSFREHYEKLTLDDSLHPKKEELTALADNISTNFKFIAKSIENTIKANFSVNDIIRA